jgi:hypothetical protein
MASALSRVSGLSPESRGALASTAVGSSPGQGTSPGDIRRDVTDARRAPGQLVTQERERWKEQHDPSTP